MEEENDAAAGQQEISLSIEETNRLRAQLGLPPLKVPTPAELEARRAEKEKAAQEAARKSKEAEVAERLAAARRKREATQRLAGPTLAEALGEEMEEDASAWIERSRRAEAERKAREAQEAAERAAREARERQEAEAYSAQDLRGLRVGHQIEELAEGESLVLTLADTPIIRDGQLNNEEDVLESAKLREQERLRELQQARKRVASGRAYDPADEAAGQPRSILPQYDEEELAARRKKEAGFVLGSEQEIAQRRAEEVRRRLAELEARGTQYSLAAPEIRPLASEYLSAQEIATFKKRNTRGKRVVRKARTSSLVKELAAEASTSELGSRREAEGRLTRDEVEAEAQRRQRELGYEKAQEKAQESSRQLEAEARAEAEASRARPVTHAAEDEDEDEERVGAATAHATPMELVEDEAELEADELAQALARSRREKRPAVTRTGTSMAEEVLARRQQQQQQQASEVGQEPGALVFTATTEFVRNLAVAPAPTSPLAASSGLASPTAAAGASASPVARSDRGGGEMDLEESGDVVMEERSREEGERGEGGGEEEEESGAESGEEESSVLEDEPLAGQGMAAALRLLQKRGYHEDFDSGLMAGRAKDKREFTAEESRVRLQYVDEQGRPLTKKEAFRRLCYSFHGKGPGKNKLEKRLKKREEELKRMKAVTNEHVLKTAQAMEEAMARAKTPHIVLGLNANAPAPLPLAKKQKTAPEQKKTSAKK